MSNEIVTDAQVQRALDYLLESGERIGNAKREAVKCDHMIKHVKALAMALHKDLPVSAQEREAYASEAYLEAIEKSAVAAGEYETLKAWREAAEARIEAWRSASANYRAMKI